MLILNISGWGQLLMGTVIGITVVYIALSGLVLCFEAIQALVIRSSKKKQVKAGKKETDISNIGSNELAAISMALHLYLNENHDEESNILTIKRIERRYSPWNSKIYGLNNTLNR